jgi:hypothetical protein
LALEKKEESKILTNVIMLIKKFPASLFDDLSVLFISPLQSLNQTENFINLISELEDCELKRVLLE